MAFLPGGYSCRSARSSRFHPCPRIPPALPRLCSGSAIRTLNRLELVAETLRAALNAVAAVAPGWLHAAAPTDWHERYDRQVEDARLPESLAKREAYAVQADLDGYVLNRPASRLVGIPA